MRVTVVDRLTEDLGEGWESRYTPGTFACHELLDRLSMIMGMVDQYLTNHPACLAKTEWHALAETASTTLHELYQQVGAEHLAAESEEKHNL
jgi:hypothetical protein